MKVGFCSLGCPKNLVDSEVMIGLVGSAGHELTHDPATADVLVINTCAFIESAKQESIDTILEMAQFKRGGSCKRLVVTGCLGERYRDDLRRAIPEVDVVMGPRDVPEIVQALDGSPDRGVPATFFRRKKGRAPQAESNTRLDVNPRHATPYLYDADTPRVTSTPGHYAYVKIAEGCDYKCSFCVIPALRGKYRSRSVESIVREAEMLVESGVREIILVSQDTTFYGIDRKERDALPTLLRRLNRVEGLAWIRLLYLYPTTLSDAAIDAIAECDKVCKYIDIPLQHASNCILKLMGRPGSRQSYERLINRVRTRIPGVALRTGFIVGFPGETDHDVAELRDFVSAMSFDHVGVFTYSHEEGTSAFEMDDDVPAAEKAKRREQVLLAHRDAACASQQSRIGKTISVLIDHIDESGNAVGRTEGQAPTIDSVTRIRATGRRTMLAGQFVNANITGFDGFDALGQ